MKELEMILAAVAQLGEAGKEAFIWWLVMDKGGAILIFLALFALIYWCVRHLINHWSADAELRRVRDALNIGGPGFLTRDEIEEIHRHIARLKACE